MVTYSVIVSVTLHVLTVDTGRIEAVALITRAFISQTRAMAPPQTHDPQVKACHLFYFRNADCLGKGLQEKAHLYNSSHVSGDLFILILFYLIFTRKTMMHLKAAILALSFLTASGNGSSTAAFNCPLLVRVCQSLCVYACAAYPLHRNSREATWIDSEANQVHDKTELTKDSEYVS